MNKFKFLLRKKVYTADSLSETNLNRVLGLFDVTSLGKI